MNISIILPIRNAESTIRRSIDSILQQSHTEYEMLCVINGSSDASEDIVRQYQKVDSRIKMLESKPGLVPALNCGIRHARFDTIARQDADDYWYPNKLQKQCEFLKSNPDIDILGVQIRCVDKDFMETKQEQRRPTEDAQIKMALLGGWNVIPHPGVLFKKSIMDKLGGYDDTFSFAEDYSLWLRAIQWYKFAILDEVLLDYTAVHNPKYDPRIPQFLSSVYRAFYGVK